MKNEKCTKIVCTIGPAVSSVALLEELYKKGMSIARVNGSYGDIDSTRLLVQLIRKTLKDKVKILLDLPGNKIRFSNLANPLKVSTGETFIIKKDMLNYPALHQKLSTGDIISYGDGAMRLIVKRIHNGQIICTALSDGIIKKGKGIIIPGIHHDIPFDFPKDIELTNLAVELGVEYLGLSFVRRSENVRRIKSQLVGTNIKIVAKIETQESVSHIDDILQYADLIMIDRGDLEFEVGRERLLPVQKAIIKRANLSGVPVIVASQFLASMLDNALPKISEVSDVTNAILDGADMIMLSEETAIGKYPLAAVENVLSISKAVMLEKEKNIKVFILAAGPSAGFGSLTAYKHKCLLDVGGSTIIEHQMDNIRRCGISEESVYLITGYNAKQIETYLTQGGHKVNFIYNPWYDTTNILVSLWLARNYNDAFVVLYGDIVFEWTILKDLLQKESDICLVVDRRNKYDAEDEKVIIKSNRILQVNKEIDNKKADAEFIGLAKFSEKGARLVSIEMDKIVREGQQNAFLSVAIERLIKNKEKVDYLLTGGRAWSDNDNLSDLEYTQHVIFPKIKKLRLR